MTVEKRVRTKAAIDRALEGRDDGFRAMVLDLALKNQWDVDDPAFLILLATGEMRVLMRQHPAEFEALMNRVFKQTEGQWQVLNAKLLTAVAASEQSGVAVAEQLEAMTGALQVERRALEHQVAGMKEARRSEWQAVVKRMNDLVEQQVRLLEAKTRELTALGVAANQAEATKQVNVMAQQFRKVFLWEAIAWACGSAIALGSVAWMGGWLARAHAVDNSPWSDIQRWNQDHYQACLEAKKNTCNFHIEVPKE